MKEEDKLREINSLSEQTSSGDGSSAESCMLESEYERLEKEGKIKNRVYVCGLGWMLPTVTTYGCGCGCGEEEGCGCGCGEEEGCGCGYDDFCPTCGNSKDFCTCNNGCGCGCGCGKNETEGDYDNNFVPGVNPGTNEVTGGETNNSKYIKLNNLDNLNDSIFNNLSAALNTFMGYTKKAKEMLELLAYKGRLFLIKDNPDPDSLEHHFYNQTNKSLYLANDGSPYTIIHETIHMIQDSTGTLEYELSSSNNEYQAELGTLLMKIAIEHPDSTSIDTFEMNNKFGINTDSYLQLYNTVINGSGKHDSIKWIGASVINYLNSTPTDTIEDRMNSFINYYKMNYGPGKAEGYKKNSNPNYNWDWREIFDKFGFFIDNEK